MNLVIVIFQLILTILSSNILNLLEFHGELITFASYFPQPGKMILYLQTQKENTIPLNTFKNIPIFTTKSIIRIHDLAFNVDLLIKEKLNHSLKKKLLDFNSNTSLVQSNIFITNKIDTVSDLDYGVICMAFTTTTRRINESEEYYLIRELTKIGTLPNDINETEQILEVLEECFGASYSFETVYLYFEVKKLSYYFSRNKKLSAKHKNAVKLNIKMESPFDLDFLDTENRLELNNIWANNLAKDNIRFKEFVIEVEFFKVVIVDVSEETVRIFIDEEYGDGYKCNYFQIFAKGNDFGTEEEKYISLISWFRYSHTNVDLIDINVINFIERLSN